MGTKRLTLVWLTVLMAVPAWATADDTVDGLGLARAACEELRLDGRYDESFACLSELWTTRRDDLSREGKIDVLRQMGEIYSIRDRSQDAQLCYERILSFDPHWRPVDFDAFPPAWRKPILDAYKARGYLLESRELRNVAVLDFEIVDLSQEGGDIGRLSKALPAYISSYLQEVLNGRVLTDDDAPLHVVSQRERPAIMEQLAQSLELAEDEDVNLANVDPMAVAKTGELQAVHGFINGTVVRTQDGKITIALRMLSVQSGKVLCPVTENGKEDDLFPLLQSALDEWIECGVGDEVRYDGRGPGELGPMAQGVLALERYHEALQLANQERYPEALALAEEALTLRPQAEDIAELVRLIEMQYSMSELTTDMNIPTVDLR